MRRGKIKFRNRDHSQSADMLQFLSEFIFIPCTFAGNLRHRIILYPFRHINQNSIDTVLRQKINNFPPRAFLGKHFRIIPRIIFSVGDFTIPVMPHTGAQIDHIRPHHFYRPPFFVYRSLFSHNELLQNYLTLPIHCQYTTKKISFKSQLFLLLQII